MGALRPVELVTISAAAKRLGLARTTVSNWANRDGLLHPRGLDREGTALYDLAAVRSVADERARARVGRPS